MDYSFRKQFSEVQNSSKRMIPFWVAATLTAVISVLFARIFGWSEKLAHHWLAAHALWAFAIVPLAILGSTMMAQIFAPFASGSGIPQLLAAMEAGEQPSPFLKRLLGVKVIIVKLFGSCLCVAGGGVTGREGPMLQISAGLFYWLHEKWPHRFGKPQLRAMILAGGAAGLAAAFNTPLGGVIFAVEELGKVHVSQIRTYVFHSVIFAGLLAQAFLGNYLYIGKTAAIQTGFTELVLVIIACALIGGLAAISSKGLVLVYDWRATQKRSTNILMTLACGLLVATLAFVYGSPAIGSGREVIVDLLAHPTPAPFSLGMLRSLGNFLTYAGGAIGGVFAPSLASGAALGSWMAGVFSPSTPHIWVLAGMVAFLTGVTRSPFTSFILVFEMTDTHGVIMVLMLAALFAQGVAKLVDPISFYEHIAERILHSNGHRPAS